MGFFKKKPDPISERAKTLNEQIAALEAEIQRLSTPEPAAEPQQSVVRTPPDSRSASQPKLRSTTLPHGHGGSTINAQPQPAVPASPPAPTEEPVIEDVNPFRASGDVAPPPARPDLGVRNSEPATIWDRIKNNFRGPATSNPKLVNYLAAGSIQGLRPLRYEKRVARNRFLLFVAALALVLWGLLAAFLKR
jgi:hypothetical protein